MNNFCSFSSFRSGTTVPDRNDEKLVGEDPEWSVPSHVSGQYLHVILQTISLNSMTGRCPGPRCSSSVIDGSI